MKNTFIAMGAGFAVPVVIGGSLMLAAATAYAG